MATAARLRTIRVTPAECINTSANRTEQLRVSAEFADGSTRDVTRQASFDLSDPTLAEVSTVGLVHARGPCELAVAVRHLAGWLTRNNRQFASNLANRTWFHLMGRGIVEPVDEFRESNPPSNPGLLEALTDDLVSHGMELKPLVALIMKSQTYQLEATPNPTTAGAVANFARASVRLLPAEVLLDAISQVMDVPDRFPGSPRRLRAMT
jgi:Protein of unknown function (DUF1553)